MLKFDEDISFTKTKSDESGTFIERKSILHYKDYDVNVKLFNSLGNKLKNHYKDRKDIDIEIGPVSAKMGEIIITINFNQEDDYYRLTNEFKDNFQEIYEELKEEQ